MIISITKRSLITLLLLTALSVHAAENDRAAPTVTGFSVREEGRPHDFPLYHNQAAQIWVDGGDFPVARLAADLLADDVERVVDIKPGVNLIQNPAPNQTSEFVVVIGTLGKSPALVDRLVKDGKLDVATIQGQWESYLIQTVENPFPGVKSALVIAGNDRRGTAYGVFTLSEAIGVSPWYWWADVTPAKRKALFIGPVSLVQGPPSVKYRGIFINDERALREWAGGQFKPETYAKIFELLLRLKANFLWPAMLPPCFFNQYPENKLVADQYGIVMGSSHCEQMLFNNSCEWNEKEDGPWDYSRNGKKILDVWEKRLQENGPFENVYTLGIRGIADRAMLGGDTIQDKINLMGMIFSDQQALIAKHVNSDVKSVPQVFVPYREVMPLYRAGLTAPDDATLMWPDDNYGYMRQLSTPEEQKRSGRAGVYYHLSFSHHNLWLSLFSPPQIAYELHKAYEYGADRMWIINVGDIKPAMKEIDFAMQMAWDITRWTPENADQFIGEWAATTFGAEYAPEIAGIMREWYRLVARGNPDVISKGKGGAFSPGEAIERLAAFERIGREAEQLEQRLPSQLRDAYLHLILYQVKALELFEKQVVYGRKSLALAAAGDPEALAFALKWKEAKKDLGRWTNRYNRTAGGKKWAGFMYSKDYGYEYQLEELLAKGRAGLGAPLIVESILEPLQRVQAKDYSRKSDAGEAGVATCSGLGFVDGVTLLPTTLPPTGEKHIQDAPWVEYDLDLPPGELTIQLRTLPTQRIHEGRSLRFAVSLDGKEPVTLDVRADEGYNAWWQNVHRGYSHRTVNYPADAPRRTKLRISLLEPGVVLQDILVHSAWKRTLPADELDAANVDDDLSWDAALEAKRSAHTLEGLYDFHRLNPAVFHWPVKVDPKRANRLVCMVLFKPKSTPTIAVDGVKLVAEQPEPIGKPGDFVELAFAIPESLTKDKETVEVQVKSSGELNGVVACWAEAARAGENH